MFFKVILDGGHMGAGKAGEIVRFFEAHDAMDLFELLQAFPGMKSKDSGRGIKLIERIDEAAFNEGRAEERKDPYNTRFHRRHRVDYDCILKTVDDAEVSNFEIPARMREYSEGGFSARYKGSRLMPGSGCIVTIQSIKKINEKAQVVWTLDIAGSSFMSGFKWK